MPLVFHIRCKWSWLWFNSVNVLLHTSSTNPAVTLYKNPFAHAEKESKENFCTRHLSATI